MIEVLEGRQVARMMHDAGDGDWVVSNIVQNHVAAAAQAAQPGPDFVPRVPGPGLIAKHAQARDQAVDHAFCRTEIALTDAFRNFVQIGAASRGEVDARHGVLCALGEATANRLLDVGCECSEIGVGFEHGVATLGQVAVAFIDCRTQGSEFLRAHGSIPAEPLEKGHPIGGRQASDGGLDFGDGRHGPQDEQGSAG